MTAINPYYYGLVKQIGPWKTTRQDILRGQKTYQYTPNESIELPYVMKSGNGQLYETYASQGLIYDAATAPVMTVKGKLRRGKIVKAKKVQIIDPSGNVVSPTDNYFLNKYMGEMRSNVRNSIIQSDLGQGQSDVAMMTPRASTVSMDGRPSTNSQISVEGSQQSDGPVFEDLGIEGPRVDQQDDLAIEEMVDRGAQNGDQILNDQIEFVQSLERERIEDVQRDVPFNILDISRQDLERPEDILEWDLAFADQQNIGLPQYVRQDASMAPPPGYRSHQPRRRSSAASNNPAARQRQRR